LRNNHFVLFYLLLLVVGSFILFPSLIEAEESEEKSEIESTGSQNEVEDDTELDENSDDEAPQILTSDLARKQEVEEKKMTVSFVIIDSNKIKSILIDGENQSFEPSDTLEVVKEFEFEPGLNQIEVVAIDMSGNQRKRSYLVVYNQAKPPPLFGVLELAHRTVQVNNDSPDETILKVTEIGRSGKKTTKTIKVPWGKANPPDKFQWVALADVGQGQDSNPTNDMSSPVSINDINVEGVVDDSEQPDILTSTNMIVAMSYASFSWYLGSSLSSYSKSTNQSFNSQVNFVGFGLKSNTFRKRFLKTGRRMDVGTDPDGIWWREQGNSWLLNLLITDINLGNENYSLNYTLSPGMQFETKSNNGSSSLVLGLDLIYKNFASERKEDGGQASIKFEYKRMEANKFDGYQFNMSAGNDVEGSQESTYQFIGFDSQMMRQWDSGFMWNFGGGLQVRKYPYDLPISEDTGLGSTRADLPIKLNNTVGMHFWRRWTLKYDFNYTFTYSNKFPYERMTNMLSLSAWL